MQKGKPAGVRCVNLSDGNTCTIYNSKDYPKVCGSLKPAEEMCGSSFEEALAYLTELEKLTQPESPHTVV